MIDLVTPRRPRTTRLYRPLCVLFLPIVTACVAPRAAITRETVFGPKAVNFTGHYASGQTWLPDGEHYLEHRGGVLQRVNAVTDEAEPAYDYQALEAALKQHGDFDEPAATHLARHPTLLSEDYSLALLEHGQRLYTYRFSDATLQRIADDAEERRELTLSPGLGHAAYLKGNNLFARDLTTGAETQLTTDGSDTLLNGVLDWVYQEEIYGRGNWRAYWWSKDGQFIAYLQLDETGVPNYPLVDVLPTRPTLQNLRWPKAGDPNPKVRLGVVRPSGGETRWIDLSGYGDVEILIVSVQWTPDGRVLFVVQDRESRWLDLNDADPETGTRRNLLHEDSPAWIEYAHEPHWLADGSFLWHSPRDGWRHLYHVARDGTLLRRVTAGAWDVRELEAVDETGGWVYFSGTRDSPVETHAYRVALAGGPIQRLTEPGYSHRTSFAPRGRLFIDTFSNLTTPPKVMLRRSGGDVVRVISENDVPALRTYHWVAPELLRIPGADGHEINAILIRPPERCPFRKYPVYTMVYGGPNSQMVMNRWQHDFGFQQWLAAQGYIVWLCDPYSASNEGAVSGWYAYQRLGAAELPDLEAGIRWLVAHEQADPRRVAIFGHSYGGYVVAYALTHGSAFTAGIAIAAVTDWRNYDTIYTERYMRTPEHNPEGYKLASVNAAAGDLHGRLLLLHGALDDNVHLQNAMQLMSAFQKAGKDFESMIYPTDDHGVGTYYSQHQQLGLDFLRRHFRMP